jgi:hypothetical protein
MRLAYAEYRTWPDDEQRELIDGVAWNMNLAPFDVLLPETGGQRGVILRRFLPASSFDNARHSSCPESSIRLSW